MSQTINDVVEACVLISQLLGEHLRCCKPLPNTLRFLKDRIVPGGSFAASPLLASASVVLSWTICSSVCLAMARNPSNWLWSHPTLKATSKL